MTLITPPALNQMAQADTDRSEMCGETCVASVLQALGKLVTPEAVVAWMRSVYGELGVRAGTGGSEVIAALAHWGVAAHAVNAPIGAYTAYNVSQGHYSICAIYSDAGGNPDPSHHTGHWILNYGPALYMNPYGGRYVTYPDLSAEDQQYGITVEADAQVEAPMANINQKRATVINCRVASFGAWPESQQAVDAYATQIADDYSNVEQILTNMISDYQKNGGKPFWGAHVS